MLIFDIETAAAPLDVLERMYVDKAEPFEDKFGEFDPSSVKLGNTTNEQKVADRIEAARKRHQRDREAALDEWKKKQIEQKQKFIENAALDPATGIIVCIGFYDVVKDKFRAFGLDELSDRETEASLCRNFWATAQKRRNARSSLVGLNTHDFDLPYLKCRSHILGVEVPDWVIKQDRFWDDVFVDLRKIWLAGRHPGSAKSNYQLLAGAFGTPGKHDDLDGSEFANLWFNDREKAIEYLKQDVMQPAQWAERMGVK